MALRGARNQRLSATVEAAAGARHDLNKVPALADGIPADLRDPPNHILDVPEAVGRDEFQQGPTAGIQQRHLAHVLVLLRCELERLWDLPLEQVPGRLAEDVLSKAAGLGVSMHRAEQRSPGRSAGSQILKQNIRQDLALHGTSRALGECSQGVRVSSRELRRRLAIDRSRSSAAEDEFQELRRREDRVHFPDALSDLEARPRSLDLPVEARLHRHVVDVLGP
mmetsp:Transcript_81563/g.228789  ORF Transcript_81563/g.228789 Transcript_81563/m.228789 type:complete len:223 (+) Transcript_81563:422-1090(+)